jgi:dihydrodipicolinate reductase
MAARIMNQGYDIEVVEAHHRMKIDARQGLPCAWAGCRQRARA